MPSVDPDAGRMAGGGGTQSPPLDHHEQSAPPRLPPMRRYEDNRRRRRSLGDSSVLTHSLQQRPKATSATPFGLRTGARANKRTTTAAGVDVVKLLFVWSLAHSDG
uniref:Uncharacterized protein n=1 Tax=Plectus sambesii TaxID=2011161 RepID=A0A914VH82_9BILA